MSDIPATPETTVSDYQAKIDGLLQPLGFQSYPFLVGWYNGCVDRRFALPYPVDTLAYLVISTPAMFDVGFKLYLKNCYDKRQAVRDPIDECVFYWMQKVKSIFPNISMDMYQDFDLHRNRQPKLLMQTAGHISGAAYYYQRKDLGDWDPWPDRKIFGVSLHPDWGGWFGFRAVIIMADISASLKQPIPDKLLESPNQIKDLLEKFNFSWQDGHYRDVIPVQARYSDEQIEYFSLAPKDRCTVIDRICKQFPPNEDSTSLI